MPTSRVTAVPADGPDPSPGLRRNILFPEPARKLPSLRHPRCRPILSHRAPFANRTEATTGKDAREPFTHAA